MRKIFGLGLATIVAFSMVACSNNTADNKVSTEAAKEAASEAASEAAQETVKEEAATEAKASQTFTVGFDQDFPPMGFVGDDGEFTGFDLELAKEVADRMGVELKYQPISWDAKDMEINSGTIDCIWNGFTINGREDAYTWSEPYMQNSQVFVVRKESAVNSLADLAGKVVEVQADSSAEAALKDMPDLVATFAELKTTPDYNTAFMDLEIGAVDAIAMDIIVAGYQIEKRKTDDYVILEEAISSEEYGVGFKKGNTELRDKVQEALNEMAKDGTMKAISEKWFTKDVTTVGK